MLNRSLQGTIWLKETALEDPQLRAELRLIQSDLRRIAAKIDNLNITEEIQRMMHYGKAALNFLFANLTRGEGQDSTKITEEIHSALKLNEVMIERLLSNLTKEEEMDGNLTISAPSLWTSKHIPGLSEEHLLYALVGLSGLTLAMCVVFIICTAHYCCGRKRCCCRRKKKEYWQVSD